MFKNLKQWWDNKSSEVLNITVYLLIGFMILYSILLIYSGTLIHEYTGKGNIIPPISLLKTNIIDIKNTEFTIVIKGDIRIYTKTNVIKNTPTNISNNIIKFLTE